MTYEIVLVALGVKLALEVVEMLEVGVGDGNTASARPTMLATTPRPTTMHVARVQRGSRPWSSRSPCSGTID